MRARINKVEHGLWFPISFIVFSNSSRVKVDSMSVIGIDVAKCKFDVAQFSQGKYRTKVFANDPSGFIAFQRWLDSFGGLAHHLCMEATGSYGQALATFLVAQGYRLSVVNPAQIHAFGQSELIRGKTDPSDAKLIARFCLSHQPAVWQPPSRQLRQLQALVKRLDNMLEMQQMELNRRDTADPDVLPFIDHVLSTLSTQIKRIRQQLRQHIKEDPELCQRRNLLDTIPGIGEATIAQLLASLGDIRRFKSAKQVAAYAGLSPAERQSGNWRGQARLSKTGSPQLRKSLFMPALVAWQHNPVIRPFCERLKARGMNGKSIACAAMRKLLHIVYGVLKSGKTFDPQMALA